jgi:SAM-dependent methyltransferase
MRTVRHEGFVQFGCGLAAPDSWTNFDASPTLRLQRLPIVGRILTSRRVHFPANVRYGDIVRGLPVAPASCHAVYSSHVLEHLALEDCQVALRNARTILRPGGLFRFVVPDLEDSIRRYLASSEDLAAVEFVRSLRIGHESRPRTLGPFLADWLGNARHMWAWDYKSMAHELRQAGFAEIRRAVLGDSTELRFRDVEDAIRWNGCLGIECRRPVE